MTDFAPARQLLSELDRHGIILEAAEDKIRFSPKSRMTQELLERLRQHKAELLGILSEQNLEDAPASSPASETPAALAPASSSWLNPDEDASELLENAKRLRQEEIRRLGPPTEPMLAELVQQWVLDTEQEFMSPSEWLQNQK